VWWGVKDSLNGENPFNFTRKKDFFSSVGGTSEKTSYNLKRNHNSSVFGLVGPSGQVEATTLFWSSQYNRRGAATSFYTRLRPTCREKEQEGIEKIGYQVT